MQTAAKAIDMLSSFVMGRLCDNAVTPWGRRKPFLILCWPIALIIIMALMLGAQVFSSTHETPPCSHLAADPQQLETCVTLKECYDAAIAAGLALPPDSERTMLGNSTRGQVTDGVPQYFFVLYFFYYTFLVAGSQVPFDALGQELTEEASSRSTGCHEPRSRLSALTQRAPPVLLSVRRPCEALHVEVGLLHARRSSGISAAPCCQLRLP